MDLAPPPLPSRQNRSPSFDAPRPDFGSAPPPLPQRPHDPNVYNQPQYNAYNNIAPYNNNYNGGMQSYQSTPPPIPYHNNVHSQPPLPYQNAPQFNNMPPPIPYHNQPPPNNFPTAIPAQQHPQMPPHVAMPPQQNMMNAPIINDYNPMQNNAYQVPAPYVQPQPMPIQQPNAMPVQFPNNNLNVNNMNAVAPPPMAQRASVSMPNQPPKGGIALPMAPKKMSPKMPAQPQQPNAPSGVNSTSPLPMPGLAQPSDIPPRVSPRASVPLPGMVTPNVAQPQPESSVTPPSRPVIVQHSETSTTTTIIMPAQPKRQSVSVPKGQPNGGPPKGAVKKLPIITGQPKTSQQLGPPPVTRPRSTSTGDAPSVIVPAIKLDVVKDDSAAPPLPARPVSDNNRGNAQPYNSSAPVAINSQYTYVAVPQKESSAKVELVDSTYNMAPNDVKIPRKASTEKPHSPHKIHSIYEVVDEIRTDKTKGGYTAQITEIEERGDLMDSKKKKVKMYKVAVTKGPTSWTVYRRYDQFFEFDKKLKSKKLLPSDDTWLPSKKMFLNSEEKNLLAIERFAQLNKYLEHILSAKIIQESDVLWMFIEPTQLGDVKPEKK